MDLIRLGLRLRWFPCDWCTWSDLLVIIRRSGPEAELFKAMHPEAAGWNLTNMLLALNADVLRWLQWAKTADGQKGRNPPEPIKRPGVGSNRRPVHPRTKGIARSKIRQMRQSVSNRVERLSALFAGE